MAGSAPDRHGMTSTNPAYWNAIANGEIRRPGMSPDVVQGYADYVSSPQFARTSLPGMVRGYQGASPLSAAQWSALMNSFGAMGGGNDGGGTPQPTPTPTPSPDLLGLIAQASDPWSTYGQMGVNEPYLSNINNRFGWSPEGLAYGTQLQASPTWYNPKTVYPDVVFPPIKPSTSTKK